MFQHTARFSDSLNFSSNCLLRVRVTPGVYRPLAQLNPGFRYLHWPGFINRTHPFGLAVYCVFIKQSGPPRYCNLLSQFHIKKAGTTSSYRTWLFCRVPLPTVPRYALGFSPRITSVGSRYDLKHSSHSSVFTVSWNPVNDPNGPLFSSRESSRHYDSPFLSID